MFAITHRSIVFSAAALFTVLTSAAAAQEAQPTSDTSQSEPASQSDVTPDDDDDAELVLAEPDFRVLNLPSTLRLPRPRIELPAHAPVQRQSSAGQLQRRTPAICSGSIKERRSVSSTGSASRGICKPLSIVRRSTRPSSSTASTTPCVRAIRSRCRSRRSSPWKAPTTSRNGIRPRWAWSFREWFADRLAVYATPVWVHNTAAILNIDCDTFFVGIGGRVRVSSTVYLVGEVAPRAGGYSPDKPAFGFAHREAGRRSPLSTQFQQRPGNDVRTTRARRLLGQSLSRLQPRPEILLSDIQKGRTA